MQVASEQRQHHSHPDNSWISWRTIFPCVVLFRLFERQWCGPLRIHRSTLSLNSVFTSPLIIIAMIYLVNLIVKSGREQRALRKGAWGEVNHKKSGRPLCVQGKPYDFNLTACFEPLISKFRFWIPMAVVKETISLVEGGEKHRKRGGGGGAL